MKRTLLLLLPFLISGMLTAQDITFITNPYDTVADASVTLVKATTYYKNHTSQTMQIRWELEKILYEDSWLIAVCDDNLCWNVGVNSNVDPDIGANKPVEVEPDSLGKMQIQITNLQAARGCGHFKIHIYDTLRPDTILATGVIFMGIDTDCSLVGTDEVAIHNKVKLYPNPTSGMFYIENAERVDEVLVYNLIGKQVMRFNNAGSRHFYNISSLPEGVYLAQILNSERKLIATKRIIKK